MKRMLIVTAGPTREHLDPVRFLSNPSTGKMGFAIAAAGAAAGFDVRLVAGPVSLPTPKGVKRIDVVSARDMLAAVRACLKENHAVHAASRSACGYPLASLGAGACASLRDRLRRPALRASLFGASRNCVSRRVCVPGALRSSATTANDTMPIFIATAAVADWRPARCAARKLKKTEMSGTLKLVRNPDILKSVKGAIKIGFAAETDRVLAEAARKCREKKLAFIVANDVTQPGSGFGTDTNRVTLVFPDDSPRSTHPTCGPRRLDLRRPHVEVWPLMTKRRIAARIIKVIRNKN